MAMAFMSLGTADELRDQIIDVALDRAYLADPCPPMPPASRRGWKRAARA